MTEDAGPTPLDSAHVELADNPESADLREVYYTTLLSATLHMPVWDEASQGDQISPVVLKNDTELAVVPVFDTADRCAAWLDEGMRAISLPGYAVFKVFDGQFGVVLNIDAPSFRVMEMEEVAWLHEMVEEGESENRA